MLKNIRALQTYTSTLQKVPHQVRCISALNEHQTSVRTYPSEVVIVEVGPRDGLQNEKVTCKIP